MRTKDYFVACVLAFVLGFLTFVLAGCQTAKGICGDTAWILQTTADNISTKQFHAPKHRGSYYKIYYLIRRFIMATRNQALDFIDEHPEETLRIIQELLLLACPSVKCRNCQYLHLCNENCEDQENIMDNTHTCRLCKYWDIFTQDDAEAVGTCERYPPCHLISDGEYYWEQPATRDYDNCGEFQERK